MSNKPQQIQNIFLAVVEKPVAERSVCLDRECGDDPDLRQRVEALLRAHDESGSFLDSPPSGLDATVDQPYSETTGDTIGPYKLLEQIGEGGMGIVYMAEQTKPIERRVALKIIKPGMDTRQVIARFEAERQALAMMDHPNIAKVLDANVTGTGRPYFVMELVKGVPMTEYCDERHLTPRERLELFIPVCQAIQHAHQKGIIHRDIKPSNVLVAHYDDQPVPKVIDFGVAKAIDHRLTEKTMFTGFGQVLGTFEYMSPEQARLNQWDVDTRSDIYSLGVLLYELLSGETPFDRRRLRSAAFDELLRIIREEDPPKPSTRASSSQSLASIAGNRQTEPAKLGAVIRGELDWIVMKALDKDRTRRYETANGLAADIQRHLDDEPVVAGPPLARYRLAKFVKRNKLQVLAGAAVAVALLLALVGTSTGMLWALREQARADAAATGETKARQLAQENEQRAVKQKDEAEAAQQAAIQSEADARAARDEAEFRAYTASLAAAAADLQRNDAPTLKRRLEQVPEKLRGWEWDYFWNESDRTLETTIELPPVSDGYHMALSRDGTLVASRPVGGNVEPVTVYDTRTGKQITVIATYGSNGPLMTFSNDNRLLAYHHSGTPGVQVFEVATGRGLVPRPRDLLSFLGFYPGGEHAAVLDDRGNVRVYDTTNWSQVIKFPATPGEGHYYRRGAVSPGGKLLVIGDYDDHPMRVFDLTTASLVKKFPDQSSTYAIQFDATGETATILSFNGTITKYSTKDWAILDETHEEQKRRRDFTVHRVNDEVVRMSFDANGAVALYGFDKLTRSATLHGHGSPGRSIAVDAERDQIVTAHEDGAVCRWDLDRPLDLPIRSRTIACSKDGSALYVGDDGKSIQAYEVNAISGQRQGILGGWGDTLAHTSTATQFAFSPKGRRLAVSLDSGWSHSRWRIYDLWTGLSEHDQRSAGISGLNCVDWSHDGKWIAIGGEHDETNVVIYDASDYQVAAQLEAGAGGATTVIFSHDSQELVSTSEDGTLDVWDVATGTLLRTFGNPGDPAISCASLSPDGSLLATGSADGTLAVWNPHDLTQVHRTVAHGASILALSFTPDGSRLITSSADRSLKVFDPSGWRELLALHLASPARSLDFSPDGKRLALAADTVTVLDAEPEADLARLRRAQREQAAPANSLLQSVLDETTDSLQVRRRIIEQTAATPSLQKAALQKWREWLGARNITAYGDWCHDWISAEILRLRLVFWMGQDPTQEQIRRLTDAIRSAEDLDEIQRHALLEYVDAFVSSRYQIAASYHSSLDTMRLTWWAVTNPDRSDDAYLTAYFGMSAALQERPNYVDAVLAMAWAEYRAGLYADALEHAGAIADSAVSGQNRQICLTIIAMAQHRTGQTDTAIETLRKLDLAIAELGERIGPITIDLANEARKVIAAPLDAAWNERAAWESFQSRMVQALGESTCAACLATVARRRSHRLTERGDEEAAAEARKTAQELLERALASDPRDAASARELAELLLQDTTPWTVLEPTEKNSAGGATLTQLADASILASGENPLGDVYTIVAEADAARVAVIRIEALTHESLPDYGPGRDANRDRGNFAMDNLQVASLTPDSEDEPLTFRQAVNSPKTRFPASVTGRWNVSGATSLANTVTFLLQEPVEFQNPLRMKFRMQFSDNEEWPKQNLGRFRISVSADPQAFDRASAMQISDPWTKLVTAYRLSGHDAAHARLLASHPHLSAATADYYAELKNWDEAIDAYNKLITAETSDANLIAKRAAAYIATDQHELALNDLVRAFDLDPIAETAFQIASIKKWHAAIDAYNRLITRETKDVHLFSNRANAYAQTEQWEQATADWKRGDELWSEFLESVFQLYQEAEQWAAAGHVGLLILEKQPKDEASLSDGDTLMWLQVGTALAAAGDQVAYMSFCDQLLKKFPELQSPANAERICKACLLVPDSIEVGTLPVELLGRSLDENSAVPAWMQPWGWSTRALVAYRNGQPDLAVEYATRAGEYDPPQDCHALILGILALAQHDLGNQEPASKVRKELAQIFPDRSRMGGNHDQLIARILYDEAKSKIENDSESSEPLDSS